MADSEMSSQGANEAWSVRERVVRRMRLSVLQAQLSAAAMADEARFQTLPDELRAGATESLLARTEEIQSLAESIGVERPFPDGDRCCVVRDEPLFGEMNPPELESLLYHYTQATKLPLIEETMSLRFQPLSKMNDPHEALDSHAFSTGLMGLAGESLVLTEEESASFHSGDWIAEVNAVRRNVKVGAFVMDVRPELDDVPVDAAGDIVPFRLFASRGFAHPRMWAQYAANSEGVCLLLDWNRLEEAVSKSVDGLCWWGRGAVTYQSAVEELSLGFFDARDLVRHGAAPTVMKNFEESLLTKHGDWAHEAEYRYFVMDGTDKPWDVPISSGVVAGLILGPRFDEACHKEELASFARAFDILGRVRRLHWTHGRPQLDRVTVR